jgi:hypothetical protein
VSRCLEKDPVLRPSARELGRKLAALANERHVPPLETLTSIEPLNGAQKAEPATTIAAREVPAA